MKNVNWYLYILLCTGDRLYTGITTDIRARFAAHQSGKGAKFTQGFPPRRILYTQLFANRSEAAKAEHAIKKMSAVQKRQFIAQASKTGAPLP